MYPINPHTPLAKPDIDHPSLFKEGPRVVNLRITRNTTPPCQGGDGGGDHLRQTYSHTGEKQESDNGRNKTQQLLYAKKYPNHNVIRV